jgi:putative Holliday junction resolvase
MRPLRALGLDVGTKTIGVAVSDALGLAAHPLKTLLRKGTRKDVDEVCTLARDKEVEAVVVGLPLTLEGTVGPRARAVLAFVEKLRLGLGSSIPVETWDERFSTVAAERVLLEADLSRARRKQVIDKQAAAFLLQGWLDARAKSE